MHKFLLFDAESENHLMSSDDARSIIAAGTKYIQKMNRQAAIYELVASGDPPMSGSGQHEEPDTASDEEDINDIIDQNNGSCAFCSEPEETDVERIKKFHELSLEMVKLFDRFENDETLSEVLLSHLKIAQAAYKSVN